MIDTFIQELRDANRDYLFDAFSSWQRGIQYEIDFWDTWFKTKGGEWNADYHSRLQPKPLVDWLARLLPSNSGRTVRVLDVGAGPITKTGTFVPGVDAEIVAIDPLAHFYRRIMNKYNVYPPIQTRFGFTEDISARFEVNSFSLITCTNALDHAIEPMWGLLEMLICLKTSGRIFLSHRCDEAEEENYTGFHQWNFTEESGDFIIWNNNIRRNVTNILSDVATVSTNVTYSDKSPYIAVEIEKHTHLPIDLLSYQREMRSSVLELLTRLFEPTIADD